MNINDLKKELISRFEEYQTVKENYEKAKWLYASLPIDSITTDFKTGRVLSIKWDENELEMTTKKAKEFLDSLD